MDKFGNDDHPYDDNNLSDSDSEGSMHDGQHAPLDSTAQPTKSALKNRNPLTASSEATELKPELPPQTAPDKLDVSTLTPLTPEVIARQATINIGME